MQINTQFTFKTRKSSVCIYMHNILIYVRVYQSN